MATVSKQIGSLAFAKQAAQGTPAADAQYGINLKGGATAAFESTDTVDEETGQTFASSAYRSEVAVGFAVEARAYPKMLGLLLYGIFGTVVSSGTGPYTHTYTVDPTDTDLPYLTLWGNVGSDYVRSSDAMVDTLGLSWSGNDPLTVSAGFLATGQTFGATAPTVAVSEAGDAYFTPAGGIFKLAGTGSTPVETKITGFDLALARNLTAEYFSGTPLPGEISVGRFSAQPKMTVKPDDLALFRTVATGSAAGETASTTTVLGSLDVTVLVDADTSLRIHGERIPWKCSWPDVDPSGGAVELELSADDMLGGAGASPLIVELKNSVATYA